MIDDPGLQAERTELAWRRTALGIGAGSLASMQVAPALLGSAAWALVGVVGLVAGTALWLAARARHRAARRALGPGGDPATVPDGRLPAVVAAFCGLVGLGSLLALLVTAGS